MSAPINDGGPAFPIAETGNNGQVYAASYGMSRRDFFAAQALSPLIARGTGDPKPMAKAAYAIADAMLKARAS